MIEVEIRGPLEGFAAEKFKQYLDENSKNISSYQEVAIFCETDHHENFGPYAQALARIQMNQRAYEDDRVYQRIALKLANPTGHGREEHDMVLAQPGLGGMFEMLKRFGVTRGSFRACKRHDYKIDGFDVSLKYDHVCGDHYELEATCNKENEIESTKNNLLKYLAPFGLHTWEPEEFKEAIFKSKPLAPYIPFEEGIEKFDIR